MTTKILTRLISTLIILTMVFSMATINTITVYAKDGQTPTPTQNQISKDIPNDNKTDNSKDLQNEKSFSEDGVIVVLKEGYEKNDSDESFSDIGVESIRELGKSKKSKESNGRKESQYKKMLLLKIKNKSENGVLEAIEKLEKLPNVAYAEPNYILTATDITPNDSYFNDLYGIKKINAPKAWETTTGNSEIVVGVIDAGIDYNHPDLQNNIWTNPDEIPNNGIDDDNNGYPDDVFGWDFAYDDNDPMDIAGHGTHCAGTIAASGDNSIGVVGVGWQTKVAALKFLNDDGKGETSDAIDAINYARVKGMPITSNSWGGGAFSQALLDAINDSTNQLFIAAAGNSRKDNDSNPHYPSSYDCANIISVAATDSNDNLADFSNYGATSVDIAAPGEDILSCTPGNSYQYFSGTSMATPHVAGAAAVLKGYNSSLSPEDIKNLIINYADDLPQLKNKVVSNGSLNLNNVLLNVGLPPFAFDSNNKTITGYTGVGGDVVIPTSINGVGVEHIGDNAFYNCGSITSVMIPSSVTNISGSAF